MFRRLADLSRRLFLSIWLAFRDLGNIVLLPFRSGFRPLTSLKALAQEIGYFFKNLIRGLDPRQLPSVIARDSQTIVAGSQSFAQQTTATATGFGSMILWSPITVGRWLLTLPGRLWHLIQTRTRKQLLIGTLFLIVGVVSFAWPLFTVVKEKRRDLLRKEQERQLDIHFTRGMMDGVKHNLSAIKGIYPNDPVVTKQLTALETGESDPNDFRMARLLMRHHYSNNRLSEASREAGKYLVINGSDWEALIMLADIAWRQGNRKLASEYAQRLGTPREIPPWACLNGAKLLSELGETNRLNELLDFIADDYVPLIRVGVLTGSEPGFRLLMVELYNLSLTRIAERPKLKSHWVPIQEVCHNIANTKDVTPAVLVKLGLCQEGHLEINLRRFLELQLISPEEHQQLAREIENRLTTIWGRVREMDPKNHYPYMGLAMQKARAKDLSNALRLIDEGIEVCGKTPELVEKKSEILQKTDPAASLAFLESEQGTQTPSLNMCRIIAQSALVAQRPDRALAILAKAHAIRPNVPWVCQLEAEALIQAGRPTEAAATLRRVLPQIASDAAGIAAYVQALTASGAVASAESFLHEAIKANPSNPAIASGADALARMGHLESAVKVLRSVIRAQRDNSVAYVLLADCLRQLAEKDPKGWDQDLVREAIDNYRTALDSYPQNFQLTNNIAWLQLLALKLPREALETVKLMRQAPDLPAAMLETVGAVLVANGSYDAGRSYLERSVRLGGQRATTMAFLADAYRGLNRSNDALLAIRQALTLPKNNPREAELITEVRQRIERAGG